MKRVESLKTKPVEYQSRDSFGAFSKIVLSRIRVNDYQVVHSRHLLRIHEEISLVNDGGVYKSYPVRAIEMAKV